VVWKLSTTNLDSTKSDSSIPTLEQPQ
jgi:hypothetical protein